MGDSEGSTTFIYIKAAIFLLRSAVTGCGQGATRISKKRNRISGKPEVAS